MTIEMRGEASIEIAAPPQHVYALVSDVTRMGEWSPECAGAEWAEGSDRAVAGARFNGANRRGEGEWTTPNTVLVADEGREFTWVVGTAELQVCRWSFSLTPIPEGTLVKESFELGDQNIGFRSMVNERPEEERQAIVDARRTQLIDDMKVTLQRLKECAEAS